MGQEIIDNSRIYKYNIPFSGEYKSDDFIKSVTNIIFEKSKNRQLRMIYGNTPSMQSIIRAFIYKLVSMMSHNDIKMIPTPGYSNSGYFSIDLYIDNTIQNYYLKTTPFKTQSFFYDEDLEYHNNSTDYLLSKIHLSVCDAYNYILSIIDSNCKVIFVDSVCLFPVAGEGYGFYIQTTAHSSTFFNADFSKVFRRRIKCRLKKIEK